MKIFLQLYLNDVQERIVVFGLESYCSFIGYLLSAISLI